MCVDKSRNHIVDSVSHKDRRGAVLSAAVNHAHAQPSFKICTENHIFFLSWKHRKHPFPKKREKSIVYDNELSGVDHKRTFSLSFTNAISILLL